MDNMLKILLTAAVSLIFALLARFGITPPAGFTQPALLAVGMLIAGVVTIVLRWRAGHPLADAMTWWKSKIIWTQFVAIAFAILALFGIVPAIDQADIVTAVMAAIALLTGGLTMTTSNRPIG